MSSPGTLFSDNTILISKVQETIVRLCQKTNRNKQGGAGQSGKLSVKYESVQMHYHCLFKIAPIDKFHSLVKNNKCYFVELTVCRITHALITPTEEF